MNDPLHLAVAGPGVIGPLATLLPARHGPLPAGRTYTPVVPLVADLVGRGQRTTFVTLDPEIDVADAASGPLLDVLLGPCRRRHRMRDFMSAERTTVCKALLHAHPDLVHAHWCGEYALGALASGLPTLITVHDWLPAVLRFVPARNTPHWSARVLLYFAALARARHLTANSPHTAARVRRYTRAALEVVPNGIPDTDFTPARAGDPPAPRPVYPVVVAVSNGFSALKNVPALLEACASLRRSGLEVELRLIGRDYGPGEACSEWARSRRLEAGVTFVGSLAHEDVLQEMTKATLLAHPAREESFGVVLIEAMSRRLPVVAGVRSGAVPWVLGGGRAGLLVDVSDPRALAGALRAVIMQADLRARLVDDGYRHAWCNFRQSRVTDLYQDAYRRVLAEEAV